MVLLGRKVNSFKNWKISKNLLGFWENELLEIDLFEKNRISLNRFNWT